MFTKKNCIPCQGGIPPLNDSEIKSFKKLVDESWKVSESKQIISEFNFSEYPKAIKFTNKIAELAEEEGHHPYIHINFKTVKVILFTHKIDGLHENDFLMASKIDKLFSQQI
jgi:4a-hydroxytetrahydrobiopterin dehydratase